MSSTSAEALFIEARSHAIDAGETRLAAMTAQNLGVISMIRGDHEKTLRHYRTSLAEFRTLGAPKEVLIALNNMGMLCTDLERWDDAAARVRGSGADRRRARRHARRASCSR